MPVLWTLTTIDTVKVAPLRALPAVTFETASLLPFAGGEPGGGGGGGGGGCGPAWLGCVHTPVFGPRSDVESPLSPVVVTTRLNVVVPPKSALSTLKVALPVA